MITIVMLPAAAAPPAVAAWPAVNAFGYPLQNLNPAAVGRPKFEPK